MLNSNKAIVGKLSLIAVANDCAEGQSMRYDYFGVFVAIDLQFLIQVSFSLLRVYYLVFFF